MAIEAVSFQHSTFPDTGAASRSTVDPAISPPYNWICSLDITDANGDKIDGLKESIVVQFPGHGIRGIGRLLGSTATEDPQILLHVSRFK